MLSEKNHGKYFFPHFEYFLTLILYIAKESYTRLLALAGPYYDLKFRGLEINYRKYLKILKTAQELGFIRIIENPIGPGARSSRGLRGGRPPKKYILLTEKGEKFVREVDTLEKIGFERIVRRAKRIVYGIHR